MTTRVTEYYTGNSMLVCGGGNSCAIVHEHGHPAIITDRTYFARRGRIRCRSCAERLDWIERITPPDWIK